MKELYFYSSRLEYASLLHDCDEFNRSYCLPKSEYDRVHPNEYGYFQFDNIRLRLVIGNLLEFKCTWCGCVPEVHYTKTERPFPLEKEYKFFVKCPSCKSQGPEKFILIENEIMLDYAKEFIKQDYMRKLPWDHGWEKKSF